jgi:folate-dependent phosphoribosylglycinamide formyltransferase PurN
MDDTGKRDRVMILVARFDHCLNDLLYRYRTGVLPVDIPAVVSNHPDLTPLAEWHRILFHHLAVTPDTKRAQEEKLLPLMDALTIDLVVPARYMHVLSPELRAALRGRCINIHHSFLPSFKGVRPYHQAHARGVKLIGATAHSVTADLDEGPIIEHLVERVDHTATPDALVAIGRDIESVVQARGALVCRTPRAAQRQQDRRLQNNLARPDAALPCAVARDGFCGESGVLSSSASPRSRSAAAGRRQIASAPKRVIRTAACRVDDVARARSAWSRVLPLRPMGSRWMRRW